MSVQTILKKIEEDPKLQEAMQTLQLTEKSFRLMPLFPLLYVAWADGKLQEDEIEKILEIAEENGLTEGDGSGILSLWLNAEKRPSDDFFRAGLRLTAAVLKFAQANYKNNLVQLCESVAESAGGALGVGSVSGEEKKALVQIAELLDIRGQASYHTLIERMQSELSAEELDWIPSKVSPVWLGVNTVVSLGVSLGIFLLLRSLHQSFVVSEQHQMIFLFAFLLFPQVGFFLSNVITARMSAGNTIKESMIGSGISTILVLIIGALVIGSTAKKYQGFNVSLPDPKPLFFPQCDQLQPELSKQRCVRVMQYKGKNICRLMPNAAANPKKYPLGQEKRHWFSSANCQGSKGDSSLFLPTAKEPKMYALKTQDRLISKGYFPLCSDLDKDASAPCLVVTKDQKNGEICKIQSSPSKQSKELGKKFVNWFPRGKFCSAVYARTYRVWKKEGQQASFAGFYPNCKDIKESNQACLYVQRVSIPSGKRQKLCVMSSSRTVPLSAIPLAKEAYQNWYPLEDCKENGSGLPLGLLFAALGFAIVALVTSYFGGWVGERWQGTI